MKGINKVILVGTLGKDPETQHLESGVALTKFSLATNDRYKDKSGQWVENTEWHNVILWRGLAEVAEKYLKKGSKVYIEGKITTRSWEKDGEKKYMTEIVGSELLMLDSKGQTTSDPQPSYTPSQSDHKDDLPF